MAGNWGAGHNSPETVLDSFKLTRCCFCWTTYGHALRDDDLGGSVALEEGLNFAGRWAPQGMLGLFDRLAKSSSAGDKILSGPVILNAAGLLHPSTKASARGIHGRGFPESICKLIWASKYLSLPIAREA